jgi:hypothetical protein
MKKILSLTIIFISFCLGLKNTGTPSNPVIDKSKEKPILRLIEQCKINNPYRYQNLIIFPITTNTKSGSAFLTLEQGINQGFLEIRELDKSQVNSVRVKNKSRHYIFGLAGELIIGAKQDRMLKEDVLIPPYSKWLNIPVFCTEHGRWAEHTKTFESKGMMATGMLRAKASKTESQDEVWSDVDGIQAGLGIAAPTRAFKEVYEASDVKDKSKPYLKELLPMPRKTKNTIGVIVGVGDEIICADLFANHSLFKRMWEKLLRSYIIDALSKPKTDGISMNQARTFLNSIKSANFSRRSTPGAGRLLRINSYTCSGSALIFEDDVVHLDLFPENILDYENQDETAPNLDLRRERLRR